ncbi:MAG TPA: HEAT repeat domain-containing protein [Candidatus Hydrogenedentes bacterium]|nr:HEAT repeat domain-containing protein [Candidatus Hydrogenedentota bacterium]
MNPWMQQTKKEISMKRFMFLAMTIVLSFGLAFHAQAAPSLKALIVTGQNNHDWKTSSPILKTLLDDTGLFVVDTATTPEAGAPGMENFKPDFQAYNVVVLDYVGDPWPETTKTAFVDYVKKGGGVVVYHAADNAFPEWPEYNQMIGLGGWGNRNEQSGPYAYWKDGQIVRDSTTPGPGGNHTAQHAFPIVIRDKNHPIMRGLPETWMHNTDELYMQLRGPAENLTLLATAFADPEKKGTGRDELMLFTIGYGRGRIFHTVLGHAGGDNPPPAMQCTGFIVTFQRGAEWAATGRVTQSVPADFPNDKEVSLRKRFVALTIDRLLADIAPYQFGDSLEPQMDLDALIRDALGKRMGIGEIEKKLLAALQTGATLPAKEYLCEKLSEVGGAASVPALAVLLMNPETSDMARFVLQRIPHPSAGEVLRTALQHTTGKVRIGIISSIGMRKDTAAVPSLAQLTADADPLTAATAVAALGRIANTNAMEALAQTKNTATGALRDLALDEYLKCAQAEAAAGYKKKALAAYDELSAADMPEPIRMAALRGKVEALRGQAGALIIETIKGGDPVMQSAAIAAVRKLNEVAAIKEIANELANLPPVCKVQLITALADCGKPESLPAVLAAAVDPEADVRLAALKALPVLGNASVVIPLAKQASTAQGNEAEAARDSLNRLCGEAVDAALLTAMESAEAPVKIEVIRASAARKTASAAPLLVKCAADADAGVRSEARKALQCAGDPNVLQDVVALVVNALNEEERNDAVSTVAAVAKRAADPAQRTAAVIAGIGSAPNPESKAALLLALGQIGDDTGLPTLREALKDATSSLKTAAIQALSMWPTPAPKDDLLVLAKEVPATPEGVLAIGGYIHLLGLPCDRPAEESVKLYQEAFTVAANTPEKEQAIAGLGALKHAAALPVLLEALNNPDDAVKSAAIKALSDWPDCGPLNELVKTARESANPAHAVLALRGYVRLIGLDPSRAPEETAAMYDDAMNLAKSPDDKKGVLSGLSNTANIAALRIAAKYLADEALKAEAEVAVVKIAKCIAGNYPQEVKTILDGIVQTSQNEFPVNQAKEILAYVDKLEEYLTAWQAAGPFMKDNVDGQKLFDEVFPPESADAAGVEWRLVPVGTSKDRPFLVELDKVWKGDNRTAYLRTFVYSDNAQPAKLEVGSDDGIKIWLNGTVVHANNAIRPCTPGQDKVDITLNEGCNTLLMKITQGGGEWSACARLRTPENAKIPGLRSEALPINK